MSQFRREKVMPRYKAFAALLLLAGVAVVAKAAYTMFAQREYWAVVASKYQSEDDSIKPNRGNVLSCDGQLLASSIPEYEIFVDFRPGYNRNHPEMEDTAWAHKRDTMWRDSMDIICEGLNRIFPERSAEDFKAHLLKGLNEGKRHWPIWKGHIDYVTYREVMALPMFNLPKNKGGFHENAYEARRHPFGSLAERTIGSRDTARYGIELAYDSLLRGHVGVRHKHKVRNQQVYSIVTPAEDGADVVSTIDVGIQDLAENALLDELRTRNALMGVAIVMEVQTGDIKAIVNMEKSSDGQYRERLNNALGYRCEPGSVFKTASMLVALDDGVIDTSYVIHTGSGIMKMHGANMKDHNWHRGGYGSINAARALEVSSNIGVSYVIDHFYGQHPEKYVEGLHRVGIGMDLQLPFNEYKKPWIRYPDYQTSVRGLYWSKTTLPWMSIGYETQIAPINTLTFYNAIANNGRMVQPRFVKEVVRDGQVVKQMPVVVLKEQIAKPQTIATMQTVLEHVVSQGLGKRAGSPDFKVAGKTGTAQVSDGVHSYRSGNPCYWLSFCGYFPADNPRYSCIVCVKNEGGPASGGLISGTVFHNIAEGVMSNNVRMAAANARDEHSVLIPDVKNGDVNAADYVLEHLDIDAKTTWNTATERTPVWGSATRQTGGILFAKEDIDTETMPDVIGMGARDAVYLLECAGLKVKIDGTGQVHHQSIEPGTDLQPGMTCSLHLGQ